jgi:hypothetical protein
MPTPVVENELVEDLLTPGVVVMVDLDQIDGIPNGLVRRRRDKG